MRQDSVQVRKEFMLRPEATATACMGWGERWKTETNLRSSEYQKKLKSSGSFAPQTPSQLRCSIWRCGGRPASAGQPPPAPSAWPRAQTRAARSCGVRGSHFPALFDYFNLERNFVLNRPADLHRAKLSAHAA